VSERVKVLEAEMDFEVVGWSRPLGSSRLTVLPIPRQAKGTFSVWVALGSEMKEAAVDDRRKRPLICS